LLNLVEGPIAAAADARVRDAAPAGRPDVHRGFEGQQPLLVERPAPTAGDLPRDAIHIAECRPAGALVLGTASDQQRGEREKQ
jgi:hypothetical protein